MPESKTDTAISTASAESEEEENRRLVKERSELSRIEYLRSWWLTTAVITLAAGVATFFADFSPLLEFGSLFVAICVSTYAIMQALRQQIKMHNHRLRRELNITYTRLKTEREQHEAQQEEMMRQYERSLSVLKERVAVCEDAVRNMLNEQKSSDE